MILLLGRARGGESSLAVGLAAAQRSPVTFVETATPGDGGDAALRREERPPGWRTVTAHYDLRDALERVADDDCVVIDSLSRWTATAMTHGNADEVLERAADFAAAAGGRPGVTIVVSDDGAAPGRAYRDLCRRVDAAWARVADNVFLVAAGRLIALKTSADG